jgi:hypothetical protein
VEVVAGDALFPSSVKFFSYSFFGDYLGRGNGKTEE